MLRPSYEQEVVTKVIERCGGNQLPLAFHKFWGEEMGEGFYEDNKLELNKIDQNIPDDVSVTTYSEPIWDSTTEDPNFRWAYSESRREEQEDKPTDAIVLLDDWSDLDRYLASMPKPEEQKHLIDSLGKEAEKKQNKYSLGHWWFCFFERLWSIRGMSNLMKDFYNHPKEVKKLTEAILEHHKTVVQLFAQMGVDGIFTSDDFGGQNNMLINPDIWRDIFKPVYRELINEVHDLGMHFWLHSCGHITEILGDLIELGVDVIHPIQAGTMDREWVADNYGGDITFLVGIDVQQMPNWSVEETRNRVRKIIKTFNRSHGGLMLAAGNAFLPGTPIENVKAFLEEATIKGAKTSM